jgi:chromosome segregation ATPase
MAGLKLVVVAFAAVSAHAAAVEATPIEKVIEMLASLETTVIGEGDESHKVFAEFSEWCEDKSRSLGFSIKTSAGEIASLKATIAKEASDIEGFNTKIEELAAELALDTADLKAATEIRAKEQADFAAEEKELMEVIDTLKRAIAILEREMAKIGSASMLQVKGASVVDALKAMVQASLLSSSDVGKLTSLLQSMQKSGEDDSDIGAPDADVYQGHADGMGRQQDGGIIATLEDLLDKANTQLDGLRKAETSSLQNFQVLEQNLKDEIKNGNTDLSDAKKGLAASGSAKAEAEGDLDATSKDMASDESTKAALHANCMEKAETFEAEVKSRAEELKALAEAKKVLKETTSGAGEQSYSFLQLGSGIASGVDLAHFEAVRFVQDLAQKQNSKSLAQLAMRMSSAIRAGQAAGADPFAKIKSLISDMIAKLEDEAAADADHKAYCDKELSENEAKEADKIAEIEKLSTKIDQWSARSAQLKGEVAALQESLAELASSQAEMDKIRAEEKAVYDKSRPEMEKGLEGVKLALKILSEYYSKDGKAHVAAEGAGASIIGLLEVVESDFSKLLAEMISTEEAAVAEYEDATKENAVDKTNKEQDVKYKSQEAANRDKETAEAKTDRSGVQKELDAVQAVLKSLHAQCDETVTPYAELKRRREMEIAGLKQALEILEGEAVLLEQRSQRLRKVHRHASA